MTINELVIEIEFFIKKCIEDKIYREQEFYIPRNNNLLYLVSIAADSIVNNDVKTDAGIAFSKLAALTDGNILVGSATNVPTSLAMSGDATITNTGAVTIANNAVTSAKIDPLVMKYATVAITASEFNGMYVTPKLLVAAGGANTLLSINRVQLLMTYGTAQFANGGVVHIQYDSTTLGAGILTTVIMDKLDRSKNFVQRWSYAYRDGGIDAIAVKLRSGRPVKLSRQEELDFKRL